MPLIIHNIQQDSHQENGKEVKTLRCNFYLPFFREGAAFGLPVDKFPPEDLQATVLQQALHIEINRNPELRDMIRNAIAEENLYLAGQIKHHDEQKQACLLRLKELENAFL